MRITKLMLVVAMLASTVSLAQDDLYLSPAATKTVDNSLIITPEGKVGILQML